MEIRFPAYQQFVDGFGRHVDMEENRGTVYFLDSSFFHPPHLIAKDYRSAIFRGDFFNIYQSLLKVNGIDESDEQTCVQIMDSIEKYFADYLEFLNVAFASECSVPAYTISRVISELSEGRHLYREFKRDALQMENDGSEILRRKKKMARKQEKYMKGVVGGQYSVTNKIDGEAVDTEVLRALNPVYREIESFVKSFCRSPRRRKRGTDEELLSAGIVNALEGPRTIILTRDGGFKVQLSDFFEHCDGLNVGFDIRERLAKTGIAIGTVYEDGKVSLEADTESQWIMARVEKAHRKQTA